MGHAGNEEVTRHCRFDLTAQERDEVDARGLNVGPDCARGNGGQAEGGGVLGNLFTFDQGHLPAGRLAGVAAEPAEIAAVALDAAARDSSTASTACSGVPGSAGCKCSEATRPGRAGEVVAFIYQRFSVSGRSAGNPRQHPGPDLLALMKGEHKIRVQPGRARTRCEPPLCRLISSANPQQGRQYLPCFGRAPVTHAGIEKTCSNSGTFSPCSSRSASTLSASALTRAIASSRVWP